jgi:acetyl esterase/lipase
MSIANFLLGIFLKHNQRQLMKLSAQHRLHRSRKWMALNRSKPVADIELRTEVIAGVPAEWVVPQALSNQQQPVVGIYFHGGAFVMGGPNSHRDMAVYLAKKAGVWLLMVDYRLAPEHPFPAALEDASALYLGLLKRGFEPGQLVMGGDSAGGNIALATVQRLQGMGLPMPKALFLFSPWLDLRNNSPSYQRNAATDAMLNQTLLEESVERYAPNTPRNDVQLSPLLGPVAGLPPCLIVASATEILQNDALSLREKLQQSGVQVRYLEWAHTPHAFPVMARWLPEARAALDSTAQFIRQHLAL